MTTCGESSERVAAVMHGVIAMLYVAMLVFHVASVAHHWSRS